MSNCLSQTALYTPKLPSSRLRQPLISGRNFDNFPVRAAADSRESLDHSQRQNKKQLQQQQQQQQQARKRAPIGLWDRFPTARTVQQMMETMESMMEEPLTYNGAASWRPPSSAADTISYGRGRTPWEIKEAETEYKLRFDMPGMTKEDVKVWVEEKMLVVKAEKQPSKTDGSSDEWSATSYGKYSCRIALPENVEFEKIKAEVKDGVLYIAIPKACNSAKVFDISVE